MTAPRQVLPGTTYLVTRRCAERRFFLRPSKITTEVFLFVLALAAQRHGVQIHAFCVMSNHLHIVLTDPGAELPRFNQLLDALLARAINALLGRWETFWAPASYSAVALASPEDIVKETAYVLANPVAAGLVRTARCWPGAWSDPDRIGAGATTVARPTHFFSKKKSSSIPAEALLELTCPPGFASESEFKARVAAVLAEEEREAQRRFGSSFLGVARVLKQDPRAYPSTVAPRRKLRPRVAAVHTPTRIGALSRMKTFLCEYRDALAARRAGDLAAVFPAGTYLMRVAHGVPCAAFG